MSEAVLKALGKAKNRFLADAWKLYEHEKHLLNKPFWFDAEGDKALLLIHGWTSTPYEFRMMGKFLQKKGIAVHAPILSGHGTVPKDLENVRWEDWMSDMEEAYARLKEKYPKVYVGGTSIGGSLALLFAQKHKDVSGIILLGTPHAIRLEKLGYVWTHFYKVFRKYKRKIYPPTPGMQGAITRVISYNSYPVSSALEAYEAISLARHDLHKIVQPCYIAQSYHDHLVTRDSLEELSVRLSSKVKKTRYVHGAYHTFIADKNASYVYHDIWKFIKKN